MSWLSETPARPLLGQSWSYGQHVERGILWGGTESVCDELAEAAGPDSTLLGCTSEVGGRQRVRGGVTSGSFSGKWPVLGGCPS